MSQLTDLIHPATLETGKIYLRRTRVIHGDRLMPVEFIDYSTCPAVIIVREGSARERCPREELYMTRDYPTSEALGLAFGWTLISRGFND